MSGLFQTMQWLPFGKYIIELSPNSYGVCFHHKMTINQSLFFRVSLAWKPSSASAMVSIYLVSNLFIVGPSSFGNSKLG